jgi:hypothetical protein
MSATPKRKARRSRRRLLGNFPQSRQLQLLCPIVGEDPRELHRFYLLWHPLLLFDADQDFYLREV